MMTMNELTSQQNAKIERCVLRLKQQGRSKDSAFAICTASVTRGESLEDLVKRLKEGENGMKAESFNESLEFSIQEDSINKEKRTVRVCALAACLSKNNRYYSPKIVEGASGTLKGKSSFADHDYRDTEHLIGKIVGESYKNGRLYADIKISKAKGLSGQMWEKINDGTVDAVSIAASGKAVPKKMKGQIVAEVVELDIKSVDFVPEGGIKSAKVVQVFEDIKDIPEISEVKEKVIENVEQLRTEYPDLVVLVEEPWKTKVEDAKTKTKKAEDELADIKIADFKEAEISKIDTTDKVKEILREKVSGKTEKEIKDSIKKEFSFIESVSEALDGEAKIKGIKSADKGKKKEDKTKWTSKIIQEDERISDNLKGEAINLLWTKGSKVMVEYLKKCGVEL